MVTRFDGEISLSGESAFSMTPRVVALPDGGFVTVTAATGTSMQDIFLQRYDGLGNPVGPLTKVNTLIYNLSYSRGGWKGLADVA